jgi:threonine-phosphate decarboxylase
MEKLTHGGNIWELVERYKFNMNEIIDFSSNINPFFDFSKIKKIIYSSLNEICFYPEIEYRKTREKIAEKFGLNYKNILLGNGSIELIYILPKSLNFKKSLILIPTFSEYERAVKSNGGEVLFFEMKEENNFKINLNEILKYIKYFDSIFICNPNNPTGTFIEKEEILSISNKLNEKFIIIDEAFIDFTDKETMTTEVNKIKNILVLRTLTKIFPIPGVRIGYLCGNENLIEKIENFQYPWNVNTFAKNLIEYLIHQDLRKIREKIKNEKEYLYENLKMISGIKVFKGECNFLLIKIEKEIDLKKIIEKLKVKKILVRDCSNIKGLYGNFIRISVRKRKENKKLLKELKCILCQ